MDQFQRFYRLHRLLQGRHVPISRSEIERALEASKATVNRVIRDMRGYGAPIDYIRESNGYIYDAARNFELPGLWFSHAELFSLMTAHDLLVNAEPSLLRETLAPLRKKLDELLSKEHLGGGQLPKRVRILRVAGRGPGKCFTQVAQALVERKRLQFEYHARTTGADSRREVSPQRLTHYRDNWYLDAWCHDRKALRIFALERIREARNSPKEAREIAEAALHQHFASAYGIFAGKPTATARLIFSAHRAQWVAEELWHPKQKGEFLADGRYQLDIPYSDPRELMMDILKNGAEVEVVSPPRLKKEVQGALATSLDQYTAKGRTKMR